MIRNALIALLGCALIAEGRGSEVRETPDEIALHQTLDQFVATLFDGDYARLGSLLHPSARRLFRNDLSACWDELQRIYSLDQISAVSGLTSHPKDLKLSDEEFFVAACEVTRVRHPDIIPDPQLLPFDIRGSIFHPDGNVDITVAYTRHVVTERTDYQFILPLVVVFRREARQWQVLSCPLSRWIATRWKQDLACR